MTAYGVAVYVLEKPSWSVPYFLWEITAFFTMGFFGIDSLFFVLNYLYDKRGGLLNKIFAYS